MKSLKNNITTIIWDWNGTLLDDVDTCISCMNMMLGERDLKPLNRETYLDIFTFPVKDYYIQAGFDFKKEPFEIPAHQFIDLYRKMVLSSPLQHDVKEILTYFKDSGYIQAVLSAMEMDFLIETMGDKEITHYFKAIYGIDNHLGAGKTITASKMMEELKCQPGATIMIGDTLHDAEVAREIGIDCILVAHGHQSFKRLEGTGYRVIHSLGELKNLL